MDLRRAVLSQGEHEERVTKDDERRMLGYTCPLILAKLCEFRDLTGIYNIIHTKFSTMRVFGPE